MGAFGSERSQPLLLRSAETFEEAPPDERARRNPANSWPLVFAATLGAFWVGAALAYLGGYLGPAGLSALSTLPVHQIVLIGIITFAPPILLLVGAWAFSHGLAMAASATALADATDRLFSADETAARTAARLGRAVRRELDALNAGLDGAFARLRALESVLENQIAALNEASARADVRAEAVAARLTQERERIDMVAASLADSSSRSSELIAGRAAQLKSMIESAEGTLKTAGQLLETQAATFRAAAQSAAEAPHTAAVELDKQAKRIESVSDAAMARAEFLLGRHERHRASMGELLQRLKEEGSSFESALGQQRSAMEQSIGALSGQARVFETMAGEAERQLESIMTAGSARATQIAASFGREAERMKETCDAACVTLGKLVTSLHDAGAGAQTLIGETTSEAKTKAKALVGEAMAECDKLLRLARDLATQTGEVREVFSQASSELQRHIIALPGIAQQEATRVRDIIRTENEEILDLSARTLATIHARTSGGRAQPHPEAAQPEPEPESEGLLGLARKLTHRPKKKEAPPAEAKSWEMSTLLSAVDSSDSKDRALKPQAAAALGALEAALADLAIDLDAINVDGEPGEDEWRRYLAGDRAVFARRIADVIDSVAINRIAVLNRENVRFREAANTYMAEFEAMLARAREGDSGGLLASTLLSADTGKIYLAIAYALGRLSP